MEDSPELLCMIWCNAHDAWWKPGAIGYVKDPKEAGLFPVSFGKKVVSAHCSADFEFPHLVIRFVDMPVGFRPSMN